MFKTGSLLGFRIGVVHHPLNSEPVFKTAVIVAPGLIGDRHLYRAAGSPAQEILGKRIRVQRISKKRANPAPWKKHDLLGGILSQRRGNHAAIAVKVLSGKTIRILPYC